MLSFAPYATAGPTLLTPLIFPVISHLQDGIRENLNISKFTGVKSNKWEYFDVCSYFGTGYTLIQPQNTSRMTSSLMTSSSMLHF